MKLSKSLLQDKELGSNIFNNSIKKSKILLTDVFDLDFKNKDSRIKKLVRKDELYLFNVIFNLNGREITATLFFEPEKGDIVQEVLRINEVVKDSLVLNSFPTDYKGAIGEVMDLLEEKYQLKFTPLDPEEKDKKIKTINENSLDKSWETIFTHEDYESEFKACFDYKGNNSVLTIKEYKNHIIYLD